MYRFVQTIVFFKCDCLFSLFLSIFCILAAVYFAADYLRQLNGIRQCLTDIIFKSRQKPKMSTYSQFNSSRNCLCIAITTANMYLCMFRFSMPSAFNPSNFDTHFEFVIEVFSRFIINNVFFPFSPSLKGHSFVL